MKKRMFLMLVVMAAFVSAIGAVKYNQVKKAIAQHSSFQPPPEAVTTVVTKREEWPATLDAIGTAVAVHGVTVSADLPGIVDKIHIDSGKMIRQGAVLVELDTREERAQLAAAQAQQKWAQISYDRYKGLLAKGVLAQADFDKSAADDAQARARVVEIRATIERKTIRAPFSGVLGIRQVNLGQYLAGGAPIVPLQTLDPIYVNFSVPQQDVAHVLAGAAVRVTLDRASNPGGAVFAGKITALDSVVNEATRNVGVQATLANPEGRLKPGMFVQAEVPLPATRGAIALPASAINYAPYGDSIFIVADMKSPDGKPYRGVRQQIVKLGPARGDQIAVLGGLEPGQEIVTSGVFKLRNGAAVVVNNKTQPGNNPAPKPEES